MAKYELPVLPLRDIVAFPHTSIPLYVGRSKSIRAIELAEQTNRLVLLVTQTDPSLTDPTADQLFKVGTVGKVKQIAHLQDGNMKLLVEGQSRAKVLQYKKSDQRFLTAEVEDFSDLPAEVTELDRHLMRASISNYEDYLKVSGKTLDDFFRALETIENPDKLVDVIATQAAFKLKEKQKLLEIESHKERLEKLAQLLLGEVEVIKIDRKIKSRVREQIEKSQRDYYLNEQLNAINKELGHEADPKSELAELEKRLAEKKMPQAARERAEREIKKLRGTTHAAEQGVVRNYIDLILDLPWEAYSTDTKELQQAQEILDQDHYGLKEAKDRIIEYLAVRARVEHHKSPILCLMGPPGVGKTSLARSIARSLDRKFEKISLGGMRDEAELRGHRRTYIGALPGKIISAIRKAGVSNPVILLDEIDKVGADWRGDPASALLEILDPEQNKHFNDYYLDMDYDLSKVLFIATANLLDPISPPLKDRMEVIRLSGYTEDEKIAIAKQFILPKTFENHGMTTEQLQFSDRALQEIIRKYTREAGVRNLERELARICRKVVKALELKKDGQKSFQINEQNLEEFLASPKFRDERLDDADEIGIATGLAWTAAGGEVLHIEVASVPGKGTIQITGQLGDVMKESANAALTYIRSRYADFGIAPDYFATHDIHVHVPEGGIPKDGPSAGITMTMAILSAVTRIPTKRSIGMTGEITLRGRILPIGGLKEKILAAKRIGLRAVMYPFENQKDLKEIPAETLAGVDLIPVFHTDEVIKLIFPNLAQTKTVGVSLGLRETSAREVATPPPIDLSH